MEKSIKCVCSTTNKRRVGEINGIGILILILRTPLLILEQSLEMFKMTLVSRG